MSRSLLWVSLPDQRPRRELHYLSLMPDTNVTALAKQRPDSDVVWRPASYRRPITRFVEAGALAWVRELAREDPRDFDWVASLELCSLVTGQASRWRRRGAQRPLQAVITWENLVQQPLYRIPPYRQAFRSALSADLLLCMVDAARDHLLHHDVDPARIRVVKPGVDTAVFMPAATPVTQPRVVFVSPLATNKGIDRVLSAMKLVQEHIPEASLDIAGRGPAEALVRAAAHDPTRRITLHGALDVFGVADLLRSAAVFVTAPRPTWKWEEQFGLAYVEAQASGLPVVTSRCGSNHEAIAPGNSLLSDDDPESLATAIVGWLADAEARAVVARSNREWVQTHHDLETQSRRMSEAFTEIERQHAR